MTITFTVTGKYLIAAAVAKEMIASTDDPEAPMAAAKAEIAANFENSAFPVEDLEIVVEQGANDA
jgi:hypothetical protein